MQIPVNELRQTWLLPRSPRPIVIIGAGGIVTDAHLPAYGLAGFPVAGIFDINADRAAKVAEGAGTRAFRTLDEAIATPNAIYDLALPPAHTSMCCPPCPMARRSCCKSRWATTWGKQQRSWRFAAGSDSRRP